MARSEDELDRFRAAVGRLQRGELIALSAEPSPAEASVRSVARAMAQRAAARARRAGEIGRLESELLAWSSVGGAGAGAWAPVGLPGDLMLEDLRRAAVPALIDAATALALGERLDPGSRDALLARWRQVMGDAGTD